MFLQVRFFYICWMFRFLKDEDKNVFLYEIHIQPYLDYKADNTAWMAIYGSSQENSLTLSKVNTFLLKRFLERSFRKSFRQI